MQESGSDVLLDEVLLRGSDLLDALTETEETLEYNRARREVWDTWAELVANTRRIELERYIQALQDFDSDTDPTDNLTSLSEENAVRMFIENLPKCFQDLQASIDSIINERQLLVQCLSFVKNQNEGFPLSTRLNP